MLYQLSYTHHKNVNIYHSGRTVSRKLFQFVKKRCLPLACSHFYSGSRIKSGTTEERVPDRCRDNKQAPRYVLRISPDCRGPLIPLVGVFHPAAGFDQGLVKTGQGKGNGFCITACRNNQRRFFQVNSHIRLPAGKIGKEAVNRVSR